jgi:hypothetical protein
MNTITKEFKKYKLPISNEKMEDFCLPLKKPKMPGEGRKFPSFPSHCLNYSVKLNNTTVLFALL